MADAEFQPSKKRAAGVQLSRENPGLDENEEEEAGTFRKASDEVLASRRIVKVRRQQTPSAPSSNPFAAIRLVPPTTSAPPLEVEAGEEKTEQIVENDSKSENEPPKGNSTAEEEKTDADNDNAKIGDDESKVEFHSEDEANKKDDEGKRNDEEKGKEEETTEKNDVDNDNAKIDDDDESKVEINSEKVAEEGENSEDGTKKATEADSSENEANKKDDEEKGNEEETTEKNASFSSFQQLSSTQNAFSGLTGSGFSSTSFSFGSTATTGFGISNNGNSSIFGASTVGSKSGGEKIPAMQEITVETGEENEKPVFTADSVLFEFIDGTWKERGKGELKVNIPTKGTGKARLIMRAKGNYRLILNASLFPDMKLTGMDKKGITFACVNSADEGKEGLSTIALKFKDVPIVEGFRAAVTKHSKEANTGIALKTPENSP